MKTAFSKAFSVLQNMGQSLMLPVSVLPAAGLLIALGRVFPEGQLLHEVFVQGGLSVFKQLPLLFAIGVAIGLSGGAGIAGLAAAVGYYLLTALLEVASLQLAPSAEQVVRIDTGVVGGIITGLLSAHAYRRFHQTKLPDFLGFPKNFFQCNPVFNKPTMITRQQRALSRRTQAFHCMQGLPPKPMSVIASKKFAAI